MLVFKLIAYTVFNVAIFCVMLFGPAGTVGWWRAWVFIGVVFLGVSAIAIGVMARSEALLNERLKSPIQRGQPLSDKIILLLCLAAWGGLMVLIPLDVFRFHWMRAPGCLVSTMGLALVVGGYSLMFLAFRENAFAASVVRHQKERRHAVASGGVYRLVRHPIYAGGALAWVGASLWLGSYAAALMTAVPIGLIALRIHLEERFLRRELEGYESYAARVRYRLIPGVW